VKYETVIGIIGNTHGVKSESAPNVIASQINPHIGCSEISLSAGRTICGSIELFDSLVFNSTRVFAFVFKFAFTFEYPFAFTSGEAVGVIDGVALGVAVGVGVATAADMATAEATEIVRGGMQTVSLQT
jgi:hypothetical protein